MCEMRDARSMKQQIIRRKEGLACLSLIDVVEWIFQYVQKC